MKFKILFIGFLLASTTFINSAEVMKLYKTPAGRTIAYPTLNNTQYTYEIFKKSNNEAIELLENLRKYVPEEQLESHEKYGKLFKKFLLLEKTKNALEKNDMKNAKKFWAQYIDTLRVEFVGPFFSQDE